MGLMLRRAGLVSANTGHLHGSIVTVPGGPFNAPGPLTIPTYDGSGETTHPDVLDFFEQFGIGQWNGYRFWMAVTPFPGSNNDYENPSINVSQDGITWIPMPGCPAPLIPPPDTAAGSYNSDPNIEYDPDTDLLYLFYRWFDNTSSTQPYKVLTTYSGDGVNWSTPVQIISPNATYFRLSPAVVREPSGLWRMWVVERADNPNLVRLYETTDPLAFPSGIGQACTVPLPAGREPWHHDVFKRDGNYWMIMTACDVDTDGGNTSVHLGRSADGYDFMMTDAVLTAGASGSFDDHEIYRTTGHFDKAIDKFRLWYSCKQETNTWHMAYTEVPRWW